MRASEIDLKELRPQIEAKLAELMEDRGWVCNDTIFHETYEKDGATIQRVTVRYGGQKFDPGSKEYIPTYWISLKATKKRRFKVKIDGDTFTIDEKKLDKKIEEMCQMAKDRKVSVAKREKETAEWLAEIEAILPGRRIDSYVKDRATVLIDSESRVIIEKVQGSYRCRVDYKLTAEAEKLPALIKTLAEYS